MDRITRVIRTENGDFLNVFRTALGGGIEMSHGIQIIAEELCPTGEIIGGGV